MTAQILDGRAIAQDLRQQLKYKLQQRQQQQLPQPGLDVILIGDNPASTTYVKHKQRCCEEVGIRSTCHRRSTNTTSTELTALIDQLNSNATTHGVLLQLPIPDHLQSHELLQRIHPHKDVDGFHPLNVGQLVLRHPTLRPCTPYGVIHLLEHTGVDLAGANVVIVGASNIVGRPMALECLLAKSTVTVCHRFTHDLAQHIQHADIVISAIGKPGVIQSDWIKPEAIVVDIGFNHLENGLISGDIDFESARQRASWITPVPGGVGPMTIAVLLQNTLKAAELADAKS